MLAPRTEQTYRYEKWRAVSSGILETAGTTFLLLIAVRWFQAGAFAKALVASGGSLGLVLAPLVVSLVEARGWPISKAASRIAAFGAACFLIAALIPWLPLYVVCSMIGLACSSATIPLLTQIYQENYPERERGRLFSRTLMIRIGTTALFSELAGLALAGELKDLFRFWPGSERALSLFFFGLSGNFRWLLVVFAGAFALASFCLSRCPSRPLVAKGGGHPFRALRFAREDPIFRLTLMSWMLLGFGTLMMQPMRVEFLANPKYGQLLTVSIIALLTGVIPNVVRLVLSPVWGWLFDHMNFFLLRVTLNLGFALGILTFFMSDGFNGLIAGAVIFGISNAGGDVAWSLWVTKFAPPDRVADYMSVHTFFTGLRGVVAPLLSFHLLGVFERLHLNALHVLGWISAILIFGAILLLLPEVRFSRASRHGTALIEEVSE
jgi:MFS family permease